VVNQETIARDQTMESNHEMIAARDQTIVVNQETIARDQTMESNHEMIAARDQTILKL
jgi:hypothetical protein